MSDLDVVFERLLTDASFRSTLERDRNAALAPYDLDDDERELLAGQLSGDDAAGQRVEARHTKAGLIGLVGGLLGELGGRGGGGRGGDDATTLAATTTRRRTLGLASDFDAVIDPTDTDGDGLTDSLEEAYGTKVHDLDTDNDGITDGAEVLLGTDPLSVDTDGDGVGDFGEVAAGTDPLVADPNPPSGPLPLDTDGDGLYDEQEWAAGTNPFLDDTDNDGISDLNELITGSDPLTADRQRLDLSGVDLTPPPSGSGSMPPEFEEWLEGINDLFGPGRQRR